jgi:hypothetical protein
MLLKRLYDMPEGWEAERDETGTLLNRPPLWAMSIKHTGTHAEQNFSRRFIDAGMIEGWLSMGQGKITLHGVDEETEEPVDLVYTVLRMPGTYCSHCDMKLDDDPSGASSRAHVADRHGETPSPDRQNPAGYRVTTAYECVLEEDQHAQWNATARAEAHQARYAETAMTPKPGGANGIGESDAAQRDRASRNAEDEQEEIKD